MSSFKTKRPDKPALPEVLDKFVAYYLTHSAAWGLFHVILDDGNVEKEVADLTLTDAQVQGAPEEIELATILTKLSVSQRKRLPEMVRKWVAEAVRQGLVVVTIEGVRK